MNDLKLVVTALIKDVEAKEEKLVKMETETHRTSNFLTNSKAVHLNLMCK